MPAPGPVHRHPVGLHPGRHGPGPAKPHPPGLLGDPKIAIELLLDLVAAGSARTAPEPMAEGLEQEFKTALSADTTTVIVVPTQPQAAML